MNGSSWREVRNKGMAPSRILDRGLVDLQHHASAVRIDHGVTLAPVDLLACIPRSTGFGGLDTLAVDDRSTRTGLATGTLSIAHHQVVVDVFPGSVVAEPDEPAVDCLMRRKMLRQHAP